MLQVPSVPGVGPILEELFPADPEVLEMFTFPLVEGDPKTALKDPYSLVLSERVAKKYFGNKSPIGKVITVDNKYPMRVMKEVPANSTFRFDILMPLEFYAKITEDDLRGIVNQNYFVFVQLLKGTSYADLNSKIKEFVVKTYSSEEYVPVLRPFAKFHLYRLGEGGGSIEQIRLIGFLAAFILLIACINFMNLTTASAYFTGGRWYLLNRWLQSFLYRTNIRIDIFIIAGALTFFIALVTVSYQSIKAATANPVDSLRYE